MTAVSFEAQLLVGFDCVQALILQLIRAEFRHKADAAAFLLLVEKDSSTFVSDALQRKVKLVVTIAAERVEDVPSQTLRVYTNDGRFGVDVSHDEGDGAFNRLTSGIAWFSESFKAEDAEMAPTRREISISDLTDCSERHSSIIDSPKSDAIQRQRRVKACTRPTPT